jgi:hypothetical protein
MSIESERVLMHFVAEDGGWLHTHGMDTLGLPELEMRHVPAFLMEEASHMLGQISKYMQDAKNGVEGTKPVHVGEIMAMSRQTRFRFVKAKPMPGAENHYDVERWQIVDVESRCACCGTTEPERN